jgi:hypothetical protein
MVGPLVTLTIGVTIELTNDSIFNKLGQKVWIQLIIKPLI